LVPGIRRKFRHRAFSHTRVLGDKELSVHRAFSHTRVLGDKKLSVHRAFSHTRVLGDKELRVLSGVHRRKAGS
jgi:hypothetical protein